MKIFFISILFLSINSFAQISPVYSVPGEMYKGVSVTLYPKVNPIKCDYDEQTTVKSYDDKFYIIGDSACNSGIKKWYMVFLDNQIVYGEKYYFKNSKWIDDQLALVKAYTPNLQERIENAQSEIERIKVDDTVRAVLESIQAETDLREQERRDKKTLDSIQKELDKILAFYRTKNWVLWEWSWSYPNEYSSFADVNVELINPFKQKIKYLWITFTATNPVGDPIRDGITRATEKTVKGIGPIEYGDHGSYQFENVFYSKVIENMRIKQIKLQFFDGTFKIISKPYEVHREKDE